ncbi:DUF308 domain-containing protein [Rhodococcus sp. IEGM 1408]|uniref:DUF308 domain-containing protein n=1 Tax=Rhodococcus sp. IEGM 1408 TaxID=3082220 RepID=UPI002954B1BC|nr:DUF308 domain-containing protein [Rhodococcus sp. IEGM 1408]MDV8002556.1 DUF308 domain-containing protein [Rhodococcus sp. IEGM 1408]
MHEKVDERAGRSRRVLGIVLALAATALGVVVILVHLALPEIVRFAGIGLVVVGLATVIGVDSDGDGDDGAGRSRRWVRVLAGLAAATAGVVVLVWQSASTRSLLWVMVTALIVHGVHTIVAALRRDADRRVAGLFSGAAAVLSGLLCLVWPVLAIELIRFGVGAWLVFVGLRAFLEPLVRRRGGAGPGAHRGRSSPPVGTHDPGGRGVLAGGSAGDRQRRAAARGRPPGSGSLL